MKLSVQLYSLRDLVKEPGDFLSLFPKLKKMGFDGVEFAGYHGFSAEELRTALDDAGLVAQGTHTDINNLRPENFGETVRYCKELGMRYIGVGGAPHDTPAQTAESCAILKAAYEEGLRHGVTVYYHNHSGEFHPFEDGTYAIDSFLAACPLELDTWWSFYAGVHSYDFLTEHKDRICLVHLKDGCKTDGRPLGEGENDLNSVVKAARDIGLEWLVLEDESHGDQLENVQKGADWMKNALQ